MKKPIIATPNNKANYRTALRAYDQAATEEASPKVLEDRWGRVVKAAEKLPVRTRGRIDDE